MFIMSNSEISIPMEVRADSKTSAAILSSATTAKTPIYNHLRKYVAQKFNSKFWILPKKMTQVKKLTVDFLQHFRIFNGLVAIENGHSETGILVLLRHDLVQLREVERVPFTNTHAEQIDVLVKLIEQRNRLDNHVVDTVHIELHLKHKFLN